MKKDCAHLENPFLTYSRSTFETNFSFNNNSPCNFSKQKKNKNADKRANTKLQISISIKFKFEGQIYFRNLRRSPINLVKAIEIFLQSLAFAFLSAFYLLFSFEKLRVILLRFKKCFDAKGLELDSVS